jgi:hypothetical protein
MIKYVTIASFALLVGCGVVPPMYDNVGYNNVVQLKQSAEAMKFACGTESAYHSAIALQRHARLNELYFVNTRDDKAVKISISIVKKQTDDLVIAHTRTIKPSLTYCTSKSDMINEEVFNILTVVGDRRR